MSDTVTPIRSRKSVDVRDRNTKTVSIKLFSSQEEKINPDENNKPDMAERVAKEGYGSMAVVDPLQNFANSVGGGYAVIQPEFNPFELIKLPNRCSILRQCIDSMVTNIGGFGYRLEYVGPPDQEDGKAATAEKQRLEDFLAQPNSDYSFLELRARLRRDRETFGYAYIEVARTEDNVITALYHNPAQTIRMTPREPENVPIDQIMYRSGKIVKFKTTRRFRKFVQQQANGSQYVYFKEFGDPRKIDPKTGKENPSLAWADCATEIFHIQRYSPGSTYGLPCWINQLPSIMGIRESELTNLQFFKDNAIPAMAVLVSGGALTNNSVQEIQRAFASGVGRESMHRILVLEALGDDSSGDIDGGVSPPKIELVPLATKRQTEGLFLDYEKEASRKIRSSFRLPAIMVGDTSDYTRATADTSLVMADTQVFGPERSIEDDMFNTHFLPLKGAPLEYWQLRTNPPRLVSPDNVMSALSSLDDVGAMTPNIAIGIANEMFDLKLSRIEDAWGDYPFEIVANLSASGQLVGIEEIVKELNTTTAGTAQDGDVTAEPNKVRPTSTGGSEVGNENAKGPNNASSAVKLDRGEIIEQVMTARKGEIDVAEKTPVVLKRVRQSVQPSTPVT